MTLFIGYHLSSVNGFLAMGLEAIKAGANTFAFFTRNPRGGKAKAIDPDDAKALFAISVTVQTGAAISELLIIIEEKRPLSFLPFCHHLSSLSLTRSRSMMLRFSLT